jgi:hypothetical protein
MAEEEALILYAAGQPVARVPVPTRGELSMERTGVRERRRLSDAASGAVKCDIRSDLHLYPCLFIRLNSPGTDAGRPSTELIDAQMRL